MALDDHGLGIPVPDENTQDYELRALLRESLNTIARLLAAPAPAPADHGPAIAALADRLATLENAPAPADHGPALTDLEARVAALENTPPPADHGPALEEVRRKIADIKLANLGRND